MKLRGDNLFFFNIMKRGTSCDDGGGGNDEMEVKDEEPGEGKKRGWSFRGECTRE
jgi:hypothetical protein